MHGRDADSASTTHSSSLERDDDGDGAGPKDTQRASFIGDGGKDVVGGRDRLPSSHYSTEKSGSSGYYSSNVYSTSSVEDHIYSEPVIDVIDAAAPPKIKRARDHRRKFEQKLDQQIGLANLEKSVKSLEKHLKLLSRHQQQQSKQSPCEMCGSSAADTSADEKIKRLPTIVEGIDTNACASVSGKAKSVRRMHNKGVHAWPIVTDDSLMDLDFASFRKVNEKRDKNLTKKMLLGANGAGNGIENPTFSPDEDEDDDDDVVRGPVTCNDELHIENNYKCTKYINSCPDDAYNVEGVNDYKYATPNSTLSSAGDKRTMSFFMKTTKDPAHFQNTKGILEEIHVKLSQLLTQPTDTSNKQRRQSSDSSDATPVAETDALKISIETLRQDLESYLKLMNEQNEMEIRQFCSGLSKNYKLLTMQHALAAKGRTKASHASDQSGSDAYSNRSYFSSSRHSTSSFFNEYAVAPPLDILYARNAFNYDDSGREMSRKSTPISSDAPPKFHSRTESGEFVRYSSGSDTNFQLQRRHSDSVYSSWDEAPAHLIASGPSADDVAVLESVVVVGAEGKIAPAEPVTSHIENNLAMQQPPAIIGADKSAPSSDEKDLMLDLMHRNKPSIWQQYYGSKRLKYSNVVKKIKGKLEINPAMAYVSDFCFFYFWFSVDLQIDKVAISYIVSYRVDRINFNFHAWAKNLHSICTN